MKLNRNLPFAEIWGGNVPASFEQNGHYFDGQGNEVDLQPHHYSAEGGSAPVAAPAIIGNAPAQVVVAAANEGDADGDGAASVQAALSERRAALLLHAIPLLEKAQGEVIAELPDHSTELLTVMLEVEGLAKKRKTVLESLTAELQAKAAQEQQDAAANGLSVDQLGAQLGA